MGNGAVINKAAVKTAMRIKDINVQELAAKLGYSPTQTRNVVNGYLPPRDADDLVQALADILDLKPRDVIVQGSKKKPE
jgi:hypothetical protein